VFVDGLVSALTFFQDIDEARAAERRAEERRQAVSPNLELVQAVFDAYFRGDEPALLALAAADIVITQFPEQVDAGEYHGHEGFRQVMADWTGSWDDWSIEILSAREVGDLVLATARQRGRGIGSGAPMEAEAIFVFTVCDGLIARWQMFSSEEQALKAVGLAE
jgi:ketosteroid isomerase-like protein